MRTKTINIDGTEYKLTSLTRGQVRSITSLPNETEQADQLISQSTGLNVDDIDMLAYRKLTDEILSFNGLLPDSVNEAKKN